MVILKKLLSFIRKFCQDNFSLCEVSFPFTDKELLRVAIEQTKKEFPDFNFYKWKQKYGDDLFYFLFEQVFRGEESIIKQRQSIYLPYVKISYEKNPDKLWIDVGCGRGEFIGLLKEIGVEVVGVEINQLNVDICQSRGLKVVKDDAIHFLSLQENNSLLGISALQVVEHFEKNTLFKFLNICYEKILRQGVLILETVNIRNEIAAKHFYLDYTHISPIMPEFLKIYLEFLGFSTVEVLYLNWELKKIYKAEKAFTCPDFAVIAIK